MRCLKYARLLIGLLALGVLSLSLPGAHPVSGQQTADIALSPGWNLVSLPLLPADSGPAAVLSSIAGKYNSAWAYQPATGQAAAAATAWLSYDPSVPPFLNTLTAIDVSMGFWLSMKEPATLTVSGSEPASTEIAVSPGWNFIGYPASAAKPIADIMGTLPYNSVWAYEPSLPSPWQSYDPKVPPFLNTLQQFQPGRGYALNASAAGVMTVGNVAAPTSDQLIEEALQKGDITEETATVYKVFAAFGDSRLPSQYQGAPSDVTDSSAPMRAALQFASLSAEAQQLLEPFLTRPDAPGSWLNLPTIGQGSPAAAQQADETTWTTFPAVGGKVKVWVESESSPALHAKAQALAAALTDKIWPTLTELMGREPLSDEGLEQNGGDGALDIYLVYSGSMAIGPKGACQKYPGFINLNRAEPLGDETQEGMLSTVAHELFHTIEFAYATPACYLPEYLWFMEASADWAMDFVYPHAPTPLLPLLAFLGEPGKPLDSVGDYHEYGAYLFPWFLTRQFEAPQLVRSIWEAFEAAPTSLEAIDTVLQPYGGFEALWPEFALYNWNREPVNHYQQWDALTAGASPAEGYPRSVTLDGQLTRTYDLSTYISYLAAAYYHFSFTDESVRSGVFYNTLAGMAHIGVQALVKIDGQWEEPRDWTGDDNQAACRNFEDEHVEELVIIISNGDWQTKDSLTPAPAQQPKLVVSAAPCAEQWVGQATSVRHAEWPGWDLTLTTTAENVVFQVDDAQPADSQQWTYKPVSGSVEWTLSGTGNYGCVVAGSGTAAIAADHSYLAVDNPLVAPATEHRYYGQGGSDAEITYTEDCGGQLLYGQWGSNPRWLEMQQGSLPIGGNPATLKGESEWTEVHGDNTSTYHYQWEFHAQPP